MRNCGEYEERDKMEKKDKKDKTHGSNRETPWHTPRSHPIFAVSVVVTVKDDPEGERKLMEALGEQTVRPDELVVVRADKGVYRSLKEFKGVVNVKVLEAGVDCSRGRGRNIGVRAARNEVIAVTDAGCRPHKDWLENLIRCLETDKSYNSYKNYKNHNDNSIKTRLPRPTSPRLRGARNDGGAIVVGGWYRAAAKTETQRVMAGFLVPVAKIAKNSENREPECSNRETPWHTPRSHPIFVGEYLPASRSIMFTKKAWEAVGGYPEEAVSGAEDLEFARRLAAHPDVKMIYCPEAMVDWEGPKTLGEFFRDIVKHTRGNVEVGYWPHLIKNLTVVLRWMVFLMFPWMIPIYLGIKIIKIINTIGGLRSHLAMRQGDTLNLILFVPIVQLTADAGVIWGVISSLVHKFIRWLK